MAAGKTPTDPVSKPKASKKAAGDATVKTKKSATKVTADAISASSEMSKKVAKPRKKKTAVVVTSEDRLQMIAVAAYYLAEKQQFSQPPETYWLAAEQEIHATLTV